MNSAAHTDRMVARQYEEAKNTIGGTAFAQNMSATKPSIRDVSPVDSALDLLLGNIEEAHRQAVELIERLSPVSDCGALTGSGSDGACSPSVSHVEARIENANRALTALVDMLRSARLGLRI